MSKDLEIIIHDNLGDPIDYQILMDDLLAWRDEGVLEAKLEEHRLVQHQARKVLRSASAVAHWSAIRLKQIKAEAAELQGREQQ